jgi:hypothetical protein
VIARIQHFFQKINAASHFCESFFAGYWYLLYLLFFTKALLVWDAVDSMGDDVAVPD